MCLEHAAGASSSQAESGQRHALAARPGGAQAAFARGRAVVLNRDGELDAAVAQLAAIIVAEKMRVSRLGLAQRR